MPSLKNVPFMSRKIRFLVSHTKTLVECSANIGGLSARIARKRLAPTIGWSYANCEPLVCLVHLSDLLCRVRDFGYGYNEIMAVDVRGGFGLEASCGSYPALAEIDLVRFTLDVEGAMDEIATLVDSVFAPAAGYDDYQLRCPRTRLVTLAWLLCGRNSEPARQSGITEVTFTPGQADLG